MQLLWTTAQVARTLDLTPQAVRNMEATGRLEPVARIEGKTATYLYDPATVKAIA
jgi:DNA-binding transcriptional MerR regulator